MIDFWTNLTYTTKFSTIAFVISFVLGLFRMGALGGFLYYPVSFLLRAYPSFNEWSGDWVWPAMIGTGMAWSFGFLIAGTVSYCLANYALSVNLLRGIYALVLWGWAAIVWYIIIRNNVA